MKLPPTRRISREQIPDAPDWVDQIIGPLNQFMETTYLALNNQLVIGENVAGEVRDLTVQTDGAAAIVPFSFASSLRVQPRGLIILQAKTVEGTYVGTTNPGWLANGNIVSVKSIGGLAASTSYTIRMAVIQ